MATSGRLDPDSQALLDRLAKSQGRTKSDIIRDALLLAAAEAANQQPANSPASLVEDLIGCVDIAGTNMARNHKVRFRELVKSRKG